MNNLAVIIPVYNEEKYIGQCIESCLLQDELDEIILIDDGCTDNSNSIIKGYQAIDRRIKLLYHEDHKNRGRGASRNLGISNTSCFWITFCDADDYYLKNRFFKFSMLKKENLDGTYEWVASEYESPGLGHSMNIITGLKQIPEVDQLQDYLMSHREERISLIGLIVKKELCEHIDLFDENLVIAEDTDFIWRLCAVAKLKNINKKSPDIIRRVHINNSYAGGPDFHQHKLVFYKKWNELVDQLNISNQAKDRVSSSYIYYNYKIALKDKSLLKRMMAFIKYQLQNNLRKHKPRKPQTN